MYRTNKLKVISVLGMCLNINLNTQNIATAWVNAAYHYKGHIAFPVFIAACDLLFAHPHKMQIKALLSLSFESCYVTSLYYINVQSTTLPILALGLILCCDCFIKLKILSHNEVNNNSRIFFILLYIICPILSNTIEFSTIINKNIIEFLIAIILILPHSNFLIAVLYHLEAKWKIKQERSAPSTMDLRNLDTELKTARDHSESLLEDKLKIANLEGQLETEKNRSAIELRQFEAILKIEQERAELLEDAVKTEQNRSKRDSSYLESILNREKERSASLEAQLKTAQKLSVSSEAQLKTAQKLSVSSEAQSKTAELEYELKTEQNRSKIELIQLESILKIEKEISASLQDELKTAQKLAALLNSQLKTAQERSASLEAQLKTAKKLSESPNNELKQTLERKFKTLKQLPDNVKILVESELKKISDHPTAEDQKRIQRLECIFELPWTDSPIKIDTQAITKSLQQRNCNTDVLSSIIRSISEEKRTGESVGQMICLAGTAGIGKTSIARTIAEATGREFIIISLSGAKDPVIITGGVMIYNGSEPGRIVKGLRGVKSLNPVILLDEIEKAHTKVQDALLALLDPEQNGAFKDNFLELPIDLSKAMFIATANNIEKLDVPLKSRFKIIKLPGLTKAEKKNGAKNIIIPNEMKRLKFTEEQLKIDDSCLDVLIQITEKEKDQGYRELERLVNCIVGSAAVKFEFNPEIKSIVVNESNVWQFIDSSIYLDDLTTASLV